MLFTASITTPKNTPKDTPLVNRLKVTKGFIYRAEFEFPTGPCGLLYLVVFDGPYQLWPSTLGEALSSDGSVLGYDDCYLKLVEPFEFQIYTWNLDDTYEHWCQVRIGIVAEEVFMARFLPSYSYKYFRAMLEKAEKQQEARRQEVLASPFPWLRKK